MSGRRHRGRRGSVYVLMLALAMIVTVAGLGTLLRLRVDHRLLALEQDWHHGGLLAQSAVDQALCTMSSDRWWREVYKDNESDFIPEMPLGRGAIAWRLEDPVDGKLEDESFHPVRIHGLGRVGRSVRVYSVMTWPTGAPLDVLRTAVHASGSLTVDGVLDVRAGPASSNGSASLNQGQVLGDVEALSVTSVGHVTGSVTVPAPPKVMPVPALFDVYKSLAVEIKYNELSNAFGNDLRDALISPSSNPVKPDRTNPDGLYFIKVPNLTTLKIRDCRIEGTLLIELGSSSKLKVEEAVVWKSHRADFPALIVYTSDDLGTSVDITCAGELDEFSSGVNFNPDHTPYYGAFDSDTSDTYPASIRGVIHVIRDVTPSATSKTTIDAARRVTGCIIADGPVETISGSILVADPTLLSRPPLGYTMAREPDNLLVNGDIENGLTGWSPVGAGTSISADNDEHSGSKSLKVKDRAAASHGARQDVSAAITTGTTYVVDAWLKMKDDPEDAVISLEIESTGDGVQWFTAALPSIQKSWTHATAKITPIWSGDLVSARLVVNTTTTSQDFLLDDVLLTPQTPGPPPPTMLPIPGTWRAEAVP